MKTTEILKPDNSVTAYDIKEVTIPYQLDLNGKYPYVELKETRNIRTRIGFSTEALTFFFSHEVSIQLSIVDNDIIGILLWEN